MHKIKLQIDKKITHVGFPEKWEELNEKEFIFLSPFLSGEDPTDVDILRIINYFLKTSGDPLFNFPLEFKQLLSELFKSETSGRWYISKYDDLYGPVDLFKNVCFGEFAFIDTYIMKHFETGNIDFLHKGIASVYRSEKEFFNADTDLDCREEFNEVKIAYYETIVSNFPDQIKHAILINYRMIREWLKQIYPMVFDVADTDVSEKQSGWDKVIRQMCHNDLTKLDQVKLLLFHNVLAEMNDNLIAAAKRKKS